MYQADVSGLIYIELFSLEDGHILYKGFFLVDSLDQRLPPAQITMEVTFRSLMLRLGLLKPLALFHTAHCQSSLTHSIDYIFSDYKSNK